MAQNLHTPAVKTPALGEWFHLADLTFAWTKGRPLIKALMEGGWVDQKQQPTRLALDSGLARFMGPPGSPGEKIVMWRRGPVAMAVAGICDEPMPAVQHQALVWGTLLTRLASTDPALNRTRPASIVPEGSFERALGRIKSVIDAQPPPVQVEHLMALVDGLEASQNPVLVELVVAVLVGSRHEMQALALRHGLNQKVAAEAQGKKRL